jgi:hypothetical protein
LHVGAISDGARGPDLGLNADLDRILARFPDLKYSDTVGRPAVSGVTVVLDNPYGLHYAQHGAEAPAVWSARWVAAARAVRAARSAATLRLRFHPNSFQTFHEGAPALRPACAALLAALVEEMGEAVTMWEAPIEHEICVVPERSACNADLCVAGDLMFSAGEPGSEAEFPLSDLALSDDELVDRYTAVRERAAVEYFRSVAAPSDVSDGTLHRALFKHLNCLPELSGRRPESAPFPHLLASLPPAVYAELHEQFPTAADFARCNATRWAQRVDNERFNISMYDVEAGLYAPRPAWAHFGERKMHALFRALCEMFGEDGYGDLEAADVRPRHHDSGARITYDVMYCMNAPDATGENVVVRRAHADSDDKVFCMLFYVPVDGEGPGANGDGGDLELYEPLPGAQIEFNATNHVLNPESLRLAKTVPYEANTLLWFHNSTRAAIHGVSSRRPRRDVRRFVNIVFEDAGRRRPGGERAVSRLGAFPVTR